MLLTTRSRERHRQRFWWIPFRPGREAPLGEKGWQGLGDAIPYALWWLIVIEAAALSTEECRETGRNIPRGLIAAIVTVVVKIVFTFVLGCGALNWADIRGDYPLGKIVHETLTGRLPWLLRAFGAIALFGLVASYNGLLYSVSRQTFSLGRGGYLPPLFGRLHGRFGTPVEALVLSKAIDVAILICGLASLVWHILAMLCLLKLRRRCPALFAGCRAPLGALLPLAVVLLSYFALAVSAGLKVQVLPVGIALHAGGSGYYLLSARRRVLRGDQ